MKNWLIGGFSLVVLAAGSVAIAADGPLFGAGPTPIGVPQEVVITQASAQVEPTLTPIPEAGVPAEAIPVPMCNSCELFDCVRYKNCGKIAPCAVPMIVGINDPCACKKDCCCKPACVYVKICVPPCCDCPTVKIKKCGDKLVYDFGKYEVELTSKKGEVVVAYHK